jgi:hypothetical protein
VTPVVEIQVIGTSISFVDSAGQLNIMAQSNSPTEAMIIGKALAAYHKVQLWHYQPNLRSCVSVPL